MVAKPICNRTSGCVAARTNLNGEGHYSCHQDPTPYFSSFLIDLLQRGSRGERDDSELGGGGVCCWIVRTQHTKTCSVATIAAAEAGHVLRRWIGSGAGADPRRNHGPFVVLDPCWLTAFRGNMPIPGDLQGILRSASRYAASHRTTKLRSRSHLSFEAGSFGPPARTWASDSGAFVQGDAGVSENRQGTRLHLAARCETTPGGVGDRGHATQRRSALPAGIRARRGPSKTDSTQDISITPMTTNTATLSTVAYYKGRVPFRGKGSGGTTTLG